MTWTPAGTLADAFARMAGHGVITDGTRQALSRAVGLRNGVAHGYSGVDLARVHAAATAGLVDLDTFSREVAAWMTRAP